MIELRQYQKESINLLREGFKKYKRQVLTLPTGAGKTVVFSEMVRLAAEKGTKTLVLTDRTELFKQTIKSLARFGIAVEEIAPHRKTIYEHATIYLAMVETFNRRTNLSIDPKLIIIDEAHKGNFTKILDRYPDSKVIGATATPVGKHFFKYYESIVQNIDVPELVSSDYLCECKPYQMQDDFSDLETRAGEFTDESLFSHFNKTTLYSGVIEEYKRLCNDKKAIVFNVNIEHTEQMHKSFLEAGISSEYVTSLTPKLERERILSAFTAGSFKVLNNCGILTTGYDEPSIEVVIMNRATKSLPLWLQCVGRGSRLYPGKENFILLDFGMNHDRHGLWNEPRTWSLKPPKKKKDATAPIKICKNPDCGCMIPASSMICTFCGYEFKKSDDKTKSGVLVEVKQRIPESLKGRRIGDLSVSELIHVETLKLYKPSFIWRILRFLGKESLKEYAILKKYKSGWLNRQIEDIDNNSFKNYIIK